MKSSGINNSVLELIGGTPIVRLQKLSEPKSAQVLVKLEYFNPSESLKDRIACSIIENAEKTGKLKKGGVIVEGSSGNTGAAAAMVAAVKGYKSIIIVTDKQSREKIATIKAFGADVIITSYTALADSPEKTSKSINPPNLRISVRHRFQRSRLKTSMFRFLLNQYCDEAT
ncbi:pyridoxal-phosphate dependent enzyme [candidate division KSB1 bacterium]|nr:pyridoxal-phosphate dependent enzyme [candidate division KSB1 bacterium]